MDALYAVHTYHPHCTTTRKEHRRSPLNLLHTAADRSVLSSPSPLPPPPLNITGDIFGDQVSQK